MELLFLHGLPGDGSHDGTRSGQFSSKPFYDHDNVMTRLAMIMHSRAKAGMDITMMPWS